MLASFDAIQGASMGVYGRLAGSVALLAYAANNITPQLVADFKGGVYGKSGALSTFDGVLNHVRNGNATMVDADGLLKWAPHNLLFSNSEDASTWTGISGGSVTSYTGTLPPGYTAASTFSKDIGSSRPFTTINGGGANTLRTFEVIVKYASAQFVQISQAAASGSSSVNYDLVNGTVTEVGAVVLSADITSLGGGWYTLKYVGEINGTDKIHFGPCLEGTSGRLPTYTTASASEVHVTGARFYRSDLGGMVNNPATGDSYVPTTDAARYLPRENHHVYNGSAWVKEGYLHETEAATNLLLNSGTLSTQNVTVAAEPHTLHFTGTGTVTLTGASTDGPLVGTGTGENNRVNLTFAPSAGTLTLTVSGTVTNADLVADPFVSSHIPTAGSTVTRAADTLTLPVANIPYPTGGSLAVSLGYKALVTYADTDQQGSVNSGSGEVVFHNWKLDNSNYNETILTTRNDDVGRPVFNVRALGTRVFLGGSPSAYSPSINVPMSLASRHGSTFLNGAVDGTALTADTTLTAFPDLSATDLIIAPSGGPQVIQRFIMWGGTTGDIGDAGIAETSA
jgi:hypothetical protein